MPETPVSEGKKFFGSEHSVSSIPSFGKVLSVLHCPTIPRSFLAPSCPTLCLRRVASKPPGLTGPLTSCGLDLLEPPPWF